MKSPKAVQQEVDQLLWDEIRRTVAEAIEQRTVLRCGAEASRIVLLFPDSGMSSQDISDGILRAAIAAGVPVQMTTPE